ncbi:helix-turn-helix domain-containing protein [Litoreibacter ponti]|nr:RodZ domain-containing protein [Litoreibacter ponti]
MLGRFKQPKSETTEDTRGFDAYEMRLGDMMRGERATLGKSLLDVQRELKIKATYIAAVENCDPSVFETPGFIAGYVRSYARYLGMDPEWAYARFCEESGFAGVEGLSGGAAKKEAPVRSRVVGEEAIMRPVTPFAPVSESIFSRVEPGAIGSIAVLFALIGALGYGGYSVLQEIQRVQFAPVDQSPGLVAEVSTAPTVPTAPDIAAPTEVASGFVAPAPDALDRLYRPQALEAPVLTARDGPIAALDPSSIGALVEDGDERFAVSQLTAPVEPEFEAPTTPQVTALAQQGVVLFATRPAWVRVANADGSVLFEKILDAGETYTVPQTDETPILRAGNSGSLFFNVNGETYGPAGPGTSVAKNVALEIEAITENYALADTTEPLLSDTLTAMATTAVPAGDGASE